MCVYSQIVDYETERWKKKYWTHDPWKDFYGDPIAVPLPYVKPKDEEKENLKKEIEELKDLLKRAIKFDRETNQEECESERKKKLLQEMAKQLGVEIEFPEEE